MEKKINLEIEVVEDGIKITKCPRYGSGDSILLNLNEAKLLIVWLEEALCLTPKKMSPLQNPEH